VAHGVRLHGKEACGRRRVGIYRSSTSCVLGGKGRCHTPQLPALALPRTAIAATLREWYGSLAATAASDEAEVYAFTVALIREALPTCDSLMSADGGVLRAGRGRARAGE
jgi:hypothetical protein